MKIWAISDTHTMHRGLTVPDGIDMVIHAGDATNFRDIYRNEPELRDFLSWFSNLPIKHKLFTGGNHDTALAKNMVPIPADVIILQDKTIEIEGIHIFGSPYSLAYGHGWAYQVSSHKSFKRWRNIPSRASIVVTHGPPKGILDATRDHAKLVEQTGDRPLRERVIEVNPKYHIFGHLHEEEDIFNTGIYRNPNICNTSFVNVACSNMRAQAIVNNGQILEI